MVVLDTDVLTIVQRGHGSEYQLVHRLNASGEESVAVTIVSFEDQMRGWPPIAQG